MKKSELQQIIIEEYNKLNEGSRLDKEAKKLKSGDWFIIHASDSKGEALNRPLQFIKYNRFAQWILCVDENGKQLRANTAQDPQLEERYIEKIKKVSKINEAIKYSELKGKVGKVIKKFQAAPNLMLSIEQREYAYSSALEGDDATYYYVIVQEIANSKYGLSSHLNKNDAIKEFNSFVNLYSTQKMEL